MKIIIIFFLGVLIGNNVLFSQPNFVQSIDFPLNINNVAYSSGNDIKVHTGTIILQNYIFFAHKPIFSFTEGNMVVWLGNQYWRRN